MKRNNLKKALLFGMISFLGITNMSAQSEGERKHKPPTYKQLLKDLDANEDDKLSKAELKGPIKNDFDKIDTNEDGFISKEEFEKAPKPKKKRPSEK